MCQQLSVMTHSVYHTLRQIISAHLHAALVAEMTCCSSRDVSCSAPKQVLNCPSEHAINASSSTSLMSYEMRRVGARCAGVLCDRTTRSQAAYSRHSDRKRLYFSWIFAGITDRFWPLMLRPWPDNAPILTLLTGPHNGVLLFFRGGDRKRLYFS